MSDKLTPEEREFLNKLKEEERKLKEMMMFNQKGIPLIPPSVLPPTVNSTSTYPAHAQALDSMVARMTKKVEGIKAIERQDAEWKQIKTPLNVGILPVIICPECWSAYSIEMMEDGLRLRMRHANISYCSMNKTEFIRPTAKFVHEI